MREIRPSGSEGGVGSIPHPYPYRPVGNRGGGADRRPHAALGDGAERQLRPTNIGRGNKNGGRFWPAAGW